MTSRHLRPSTEADALAVVQRLRAADVRSCLAATGKAPLDILLPALAMFGAEAIIAPDGEPIGLCGVRPQGERVDLGIVWMWTTDRASRFGKLFLREAPAWIAAQERRFPILGNHVDLRDKPRARWIARVGFRFVNVYDVDGRPYGVFMNAGGAAEMHGGPH